MGKFEKMKIALHYWLLGMSEYDKNYLKCVEAMEFAASYHTGRRKDKTTAEFEHQITIAMYIRSISSLLINPWVTICVCLLHDVCEDYDVPYEEIAKRFGSEVAKSVEAMTKVHKGVRKSVSSYFDGIANDIHASVAKGGDRIHNLQSMSGVFTPEKQHEYIDEAVTHILPAIKKARRLFPGQEKAYENIKLLMESQIQLIKFSLNE